MHRSGNFGMQIPDFNPFWLIVGAFAAAGLTWLIDYFIIKNKIEEGSSDEVVVALRDRVRALEPTSEQLSAANSRVEQLTAELAALPSESVDIMPYVARIDELTDHLDVLQREKGKLEATLDELKLAQRNAPDSAETLELLRNELEEKRQEADEAVAMLVAVRLENETLQEGAAILGPELAELRKELEAAKNETEVAKSAVAELRQRSHHLEESGEEALELLRNRAIAAEREAQTAKEALTELRAELANAAKVPDLRDELLSLREELNRSENERDAISQSLAELKAQQTNAVQSAEERVADLRGQLEEIREARDAAWQSVPAAEELKKVVAELQARLDDSDSELTDARRQALEFQQQLTQADEWRDELERLRARMPDLERVAHERDELEATVRRLESESEIEAESGVQSEFFERELVEKQAELDRLYRRLPEMEVLIAELREELGEKASRIEKLEAVSESATEDAGLEQVVRRLTAELEHSKKESQEIRIALVKVQAEAELLRETAAELEAFRSENRRLQSLETTPTDVNLGPLRATVDQLVVAVDNSNKEIASNRKALVATMDELSSLRKEIAEVVRLREENARLRSEKQGDSTQDVEDLRFKLDEVASQVDQSQVEAMVARDQLEAANHEISHMRRDMLRSAELGELS